METHSYIVNCGVFVHDEKIKNKSPMNILQIVCILYQ